MKSVEEAPTRHGRMPSLEAIDADIALAKAHLQQLMAEKSRAGAAALPSAAGLSVALYTWQQQALENWKAAGCRGVVQAVTGAGKTRVGIAAIAEALNAGRRAVVIVPTLVLVKQWVATLQELLPEVQVSERIGDARPWRVLVTTIQSAMNRPAVPFGEQALLVVDEAHRSGAEGFSMALRSGFDWRLGLTATLERGDDGDEILSEYFGGVVHDLGYEQALADELIAPFRFAQVSVPLLPAEQARYLQLTENLRGARDGLIQHGVHSETISGFLKAVSDLANERSGSKVSGLARYYMKLFSERRRLLAETPVKMVVLEALSEAIRRAHGSIVFTQTKEASLEAARVLGSAGCSSAAVHGELDKDSREERIDLFRTGAVTALTAPRVLDEGVDLPDADLGIVTAANRSRRQMIQRLGRVLRRRADKLARFVVLYAAGTVEDPTAAGHIPDFYDECLPFAEASQVFDLSEDGQLGSLLSFLGVDGVGDAQLPRRDGAAEDPPPPPAGQQPERPSPASGRLLADHRPAKQPDLATEEDPEPAAQLGETLWTDDLVKFYLTKIGQYPLLSAEQEVDLSRSVEAGLYARHLLDSGDSRHDWADLEVLERKGQEAREQMICSNLRLVVSLAKRYTGRGLEFLDLIQEGNIGLMHAVEMFDYRRGNKFSTYATWWIKQAVTRGLADRGSTIRIPVHMHEKKVRIERFRRERGLSWTALCAEFPDGIPELDVTGDEVTRLARLSRPIISTEWLSEEVEDSVIFEPLDGHAHDAATELVERRALKQQFETLFSPLAHEDPRTAFVLKARYGLLTGEPETLEVIGQRLGVTRERIRQIEKMGMTRLREIAEEQEAKSRLLSEGGGAPSGERVVTAGLQERLKRAAQTRQLRRKQTLAAARQAGPAPRRAASGEAGAEEPAVPRRALL